MPDDEGRILVVLCPGDPTSSLQFEDQPKNTDLYSGGDIRMRAASKIARQYSLIFVVGGNEKKINAMKLFLMRQGINQEKILRLESNPDTNGNLNAVCKIFEYYEGFKKYIVTILSNEYHGPRIEKMAKDILTKNEIKWEFISAESVVKEDSKIIEEIYKKQFKKRKESEKRGMEDWENKRYNDQDIAPWQFKSIIRDQLLLDCFMKNGSEIKIN